MAGKLVSLHEAIARFVPDGASIAIGSAQETLIPFAAGREIMRQRRRALTLIGPISDILFDILIGAGCVQRILSAWTGNVITGSAYNFRRGVESGAVSVEDYSNLTIALALRAGAMGVPFMPTRSVLGSDLYKTNPHLKTTTCPFTGETLTAVAALNPDVAIVHVQRSDIHGNAHMWGNFGVTREACLAAGAIIMTCEEIVAPEVISSDPNRVVTPGFRVSAVVHEPWGAYPSPAPGFYNRDAQAFLDYQHASRTPAAFDSWQTGWTQPEEFGATLDPARMASLEIKSHLWSSPVDYGY